MADSLSFIITVIVIVIFVVIAGALFIDWLEKEDKRKKDVELRLKQLEAFEKEKDNGTLTPEKVRAYIEWLIKNTQSARSLGGLKTGEEKSLGKGGRKKFLKSFERLAKKDLGIEG
jgi:hypothetical protein